MSLSLALHTPMSSASSFFSTGATFAPSLPLSMSLSSLPTCRNLTHLPSLRSFPSLPRPFPAENEPLAFGTKTVYCPSPSPPPDELPLHVSLLARHGTRNPTKSSIARMRSVVDRLREYGADTHKLAEWEKVIDIFAADPGGLTSHGVEEMFALGVRFRERYQFNDPEAEVKVRSSFKSRATASAEAFVRGYCSVNAVPSDDGQGFENQDVDEDESDDYFGFDDLDPDSSTCTTASEIDEQQDADIVPPIPPNDLASDSRDLSTPFPLPPSSPGSSSTSSSDIEDETSLSGSSLVCDAALSSSSLLPSAVSESEIASDISLSKKFCASSEPKRHSQSLSTCVSQASSPPEPPRVQVLDHGDDASLRFFDYHQGYAEFARNHKVQQRSRLAEKCKYDPCTAQGDLVQRIGAAFGVTTQDCLAPEHIRIIAEAAAFDFAHGRGNSIVASVLTSRDIHYLEGFEKRYRPFFKGHERFGSVTAPLVQDMMDSLTSVIDSFKAGRPHVVADLRFAHAETIVPFLLLLGVTSNKMESMPARKNLSHDLSAMSPFAANFAIELFAPAPGDSADAFRVKFRLHERYVSYVPALGPDGCAKDGSIELDKLFAFFHKVLDASDHDMANAQSSL